MPALCVIVNQEKIPCLNPNQSRAESWNRFAASRPWLSRQSCLSGSDLHRQVASRLGLGLQQPFGKSSDRWRCVTMTTESCINCGTTLSRNNFSGWQHLTIFCWVFTIVWCFVVEIGFG